MHIKKARFKRLAQSKSEGKRSNELFCVNGALILPQFSVVALLGRKGHVYGFGCCAKTGVRNSPMVFEVIKKVYKFYKADRVANGFLSQELVALYNE